MINSLLFNSYNNLKFIKREKMIKSPYREKVQKQKDLEQDAFYNKDVEYFSHLVNSWITTNMEKDKAILTLSTAGLGVLITFFNNISPNYDFALLFYILSLICFVISIISGLWIFSENANYCEAVISEKTPNNENLIGKLDNFLIYSFIIGLICAIILSFILIFSKELKEKSNISTENKSLEMKISSLKQDYENNLKELQNQSIKIKELEKTREELFTLKNQLKENIDSLSNNLKNDLETIKLLKEKEFLLQSEIQKIKKENN